MFFLLGFSLVATCELKKTTCFNCDWHGAICYTESNQVTQEACSNAVDVNNNWVVEYEISGGTCRYRTCPQSNIAYKLNNIAILMLCSSGTI